MLTNIENGKKPFLRVGIFANDDNGNEGTPPTNDNSESGEGKVEMTQSKFDELINTKFKAGATKAVTNLLSELGFENTEALKEVVNTHKETVEQGKTELQKALEQVQNLTTLNDTLASQLKESDLNKNITDVALKNGVKDAELFKMLYKDASAKEDFSEDTFIESLKKDRSYLFGETQQNNDNLTPPGNNNQQHTGKTIKRSEIERLTAEDRMKKLKDGYKVIN